MTGQETKETLSLHFKWTRKGATNFLQNRTQLSRPVGRTGSRKLPFALARKKKKGGRENASRDLEEGGGGIPIKKIRVCLLAIGTGSPFKCPASQQKKKKVSSNDQRTACDGLFQTTILYGKRNEFLPPQKTERKGRRRTLRGNSKGRNNVPVSGGGGHSEITNGTHDKI